MDCSPTGSSVHGILQARIPGWIAMPSSRGSSRPRDRTRVSCVLHWQAGSLPLAPHGKPTMNSSYHLWYDGYKYCPPPLENNFLPLHPRIEMALDKWYPENGSTSIPQATPVADTYGPGLQNLFKGKWSYSFHYPHCQAAIGNVPCGTKKIAFTGDSGPQFCFSPSPAKVLFLLEHNLGVAGPLQP